MLEAFEVIKCDSKSAAHEVETESSNVQYLETVLTFEERQKSRHKAVTRCGQDIGWFVERGHVLADGDILNCTDGQQVRVVAANECVSVVESSDPLSLTRAAYHLGNRHVPLQIDAGALRYQHDHVLDAMLVGLGLQVSTHNLPFHPEPGAYHSHGGGHDHGHSHHHHSHD